MLLDGKGYEIRHCDGIASKRYSFFLSSSGVCRVVERGREMMVMMLPWERLGKTGIAMRFLLCEWVGNGDGAVVICMMEDGRDSPVYLLCIKVGQKASTMRTKHGLES